MLKINLSIIKSIIFQYLQYSTRFPIPLQSGSVLLTSDKVNLFEHLLDELDAAAYDVKRLFRDFRRMYENVNEMLLTKLNCILCNSTFIESDLSNTII